MSYLSFHRENHGKHGNPTLENFCNVATQPRSFKTARIMSPNGNWPRQQATNIKLVERIAKSVLVASSLCLLLVLVLVTLPNIESAQYQMGFCNVTVTKLVTDSDRRLQCHCTGRDRNTKCTIYYPCLQIYVSYNNATLREALVVKNRRRITNECSYKLRDYDCGTTDDVYRHVKSFSERWGSRNLSYECFYNSRNPARLILTNWALSTILAVTLTLLPSVGVVVGLSMKCFKEQISLVMVPKLRLGVNEDFVSVATASDDEGSG